ncbi:tetratricopeptide repeat protein [Garciella nitratireducens]|uniref:tetratricopeptide repeat protein n=1 Tax=Garciella nitratireducens TaxID=218205 RepID=UPI001BD2EE38|nr:hypothetical protein [Garciella nitratireducens]
MKKILMIGGILVFFFAFCNIAFAKEDTLSSGWTGHGLYLLGDENISLNKVDINILVNDDRTSLVFAGYELENKQNKMVNAYLGVPEHEVNLQEFESRVTRKIQNDILSYRYGNYKVSGQEINKRIKRSNVNYKGWRTWYAPFEPGEKRTVKISYKVENKEISNGRYLISFQLEHINTWKGNPKNIHVKVSFDNQEVKPYNFGNTFSIKPDSIQDNFTLNWNLDSLQKDQSIDFDYYYIDQEISNFLKSATSSNLKSIARAYESKEYSQVIEQGKKYIENSKGENFQKEVYFLMADAYLQLGQPEESLILYELIEGEPIFYKGFQQKVQEFITYNKIKCYLQKEDYKTMYRLILKIQEDKTYNFIFKDWAKKETKEIPIETIKQVEKENREPNVVEKLYLRISNGKHNNIMMIILGVFLFLMSVFYIRYKRKKEKNTLFKK